MQEKHARFYSYRCFLQLQQPANSQLSLKITNKQLGLGDHRVAFICALAKLKFNFIKVWLVHLPPLSRPLVLFLSVHISITSQCVAIKYIPGQWGPILKWLQDKEILPHEFSGNTWERAPVCLSVYVHVVAVCISFTFTVPQSVPLIHGSLLAR